MIVQLQIMRRDLRVFITYLGGADRCSQAFVASHENQNTDASSPSTRNQTTMSSTMKMCLGRLSLLVTLVALLGSHATASHAQVSPGDMNCDGTRDGSDVEAFVLALVDPSGYSAAFAGCFASNGDFDCSGSVDTADVADFVTCLLGGDCPPYPPAGMVLIPAGEFQMGNTFSEGAADGSELPVHPIFLDAFFMGTCAITNQQYADALNWAMSQGNMIRVSNGVVYGFNNRSWYPYCDTTSSSASSSAHSRITWNGDTFGVVLGKGDHPVVMVTFYGATAYANWRSGMEGKSLCYDRIDEVPPTWDCNFLADGYRLPTEAEWEKASGGGVAGHRFAWSDSDGIQHARANYYSSKTYSYDTSSTRGLHPAFADGGDPHTSPVAYFDANGYGLFDMTGNVWEWCNDRYSESYYGTSPYENPRGPASEIPRVLRGGTWHSAAYYCRCARRSYQSPVFRYYDIGFRLVIDVPKPCGSPPYTRGDMDRDG